MPSKFTAKQIQHAYAAMSRSDYGEIVLWDLAEQFWERSSVPKDADPNQTLFNEGRRFVIGYIRAQIRAGEGVVDGVVDAGRASTARDPDEQPERAFDPLERDT